MRLYENAIYDLLEIQMNNHASLLGELYKLRKGDILDPYYLIWFIPAEGRSGRRFRCLCFFFQEEAFLYSRCESAI